MINPLLIVGGMVGLVSAAFIIAFLSIKNRKEAIGFDRNMKDSELLRRMLPYAKPHWKSFLLVFVLLLFAISYDVIAPTLVGNLEELVKSQDAGKMGELLKMVALYASLLIVSVTCGYFQAITLQKVGQKILSALRRDLFSHIESLSHAQLNAIPVGKLVTRVTNDTNAISMLFTNILVNLIKNCFVIVGVVAAMAMVNLELTLMVMCFAPFIALFTFIFRKFSRKAYRKVKDGTTDINTYLSEHLSGMKIIQIFNQEQRKQQQFEQKNNTLYKARRGEILVFSVFRPLVYMLYISCVLCLFYLGASGVINNTVFLGQTISGGTIVTFCMYINKFFNPIQNLADIFNRLQSAFASGEKIFTIFDMQPDVVSAPDAIEPAHIKGEIEFQHVWFAYKEGEWVLKDVSFRVPAGQTVAFVGATGSGKTTILSLLCRNWDIQKGKILVDGIDITRISIPCLRSHFGQMLQDVFLFSGTVRSNILLRMEGVSDQKVMEACRYVNADKVIMKLPNGLDEEVRERGSNFSAGERQLLSFARTIIHKPEVMILDEATANIDTETEVLIQDSLEKMMNIGTLLIVAHRLSTIQHADNIILLSHGEIKEQGTHEQLLALHGRYYQLYTLQASKQKITAQ